MSLESIAPLSDDPPPAAPVSLIAELNPVPMPTLLHHASRHDPSTQAQVLRLIKDLSQEMGLAMAFISHDLW